VAALLILRLFVAADRPSCQHKPAPNSMTQRYKKSSKATDVLEKRHLQHGFAGNNGSDLHDYLAEADDTTTTPDDQELQEEVDEVPTTTSKLDQDEVGELDKLREEVDEVPTSTSKFDQERLNEELEELDEVPTTTSKDLTDEDSPEQLLTQDTRQQEVPEGLKYASFSKYGEDVKSDIGQFQESAENLDGASSRARDQSHQYAKALKTLQGTSKTFKKVANHFGEMVVWEQQEHVGGIKKKLGSAEELAETQEIHKKEQPEEDSFETVSQTNSQINSQISDGKQKLDSQDLKLEDESTKLNVDVNVQTHDAQTHDAQTKENNLAKQQTTTEALNEEDTSTLLQKIKSSIHEDQTLEADIKKNEDVWEDAKLNLVLSWDMDANANAKLQLSLVEVVQEGNTEQKAKPAISITNDESQSGEENDGPFKVGLGDKTHDNSHLAWLTTKADQELQDGQFNVFIIYKVGEEHEHDPPPVDFQSLIEFGAQKKAIKGTLTKDKHLATAFTFKITSGEVSWGNN